MMKAGFEALCAQVMPSVGAQLLFLPTGQYVELSTPSPVPSLPTPCHDENGLNRKPPQLNVFCCVIVALLLWPSQQ